MKNLGLENSACFPEGHNSVQLDAHLKVQSYLHCWIFIKLIFT